MHDRSGEGSRYGTAGRSALALGAGQGGAWAHHPSGRRLRARVLGAAAGHVPPVNGRRPCEELDVSPFDRIVIIFNPQSTGDAPRSAEELHAELARRLPAVPAELCPTRYAGHARDLARVAAGSGRPLLVSVSGDGGYNEVVDGVMQAGDSEAVCAVRAAGNANDHRRTTRQRPPADAIVAGGGRRVDLLRLAIGSGGAAQNRYAHPSVGRI